MTHVLTVLISCIGFLHLLQPPLTLLLARRLRLRPAFASLPAIPYAICQNLAVAGVGLPTALGFYLAVYARDALSAGPVRTLALGLSIFWIARLERQWRSVGPLMAGATPALNVCLFAIFIIEGPVLAALVLSSMFGGTQ